MNKYQDQENEIKEHFESYNVKVVKPIDIKRLSKEGGISIANTLMFACNLEDTKIMRDIANGDYSAFDINDKEIFNDAYHEIVLIAMQG